jgi:hypothetical protein
MLYVCSTYNSGDPLNHDAIIVESELSASEVALKIFPKLSEMREIDPQSYHDFELKNHLNSRYNFLLTEESLDYADIRKDGTRCAYLQYYHDADWNLFHEYFVVQRMDNPLVI